MWKDKGLGAVRKPLYGRPLKIVAMFMDTEDPKKLTGYTYRIGDAGCLLGMFATKDEAKAAAEQWASDNRLRSKP